MASRAPDHVPSAAERQGVFTAAQARAEGWTDRQVRRRLDAGRWAYVAGKGLAVPDPVTPAVWTPLQRAYAATLTYPGAVVSHLTAAEVLGWPLPDEGRDGPVHVLSDRPHRSTATIWVHQAAVTPGHLIVPKPGLHVTPPDRTAADVLSMLAPVAGMDLWAFLSTRRILTHAGLQRLIDGREGAPGVAALRRLQSHISSGAASGAELLLHQALDRAGITGWEAGVTLVDANGMIGVADLVFESVKLVIEVDGWKAHRERGAFIRDRRRQNRLVVAGYTVLRFTWDDLTHRLDKVLAEILAMLP